MSRKLLINTKNIEIDPSRRKHITREDLIRLEDKVLSSVKQNENRQVNSYKDLGDRTLGR